ncbi:hypothetical protein [Paenibacillus agri]|uniref:DUF2642 domain-containing protein n=1 Tax=Paenibacillus agri TaxID=2744309 RepID=A0A850ERP1_9BACL|nr:hypothetical protein [Paenibacillus agri]NUU63863.1 hypothetical protein [Paenibacillus agri]
MAAQFKLEDLTGLIEKVARPGLLSQLLGKDNVVPKSIADFLKTGSDQPAQTASEPASADSASGTSSAKASSAGTPSARSNVIGGILGVLGRISVVPFVELARENIGNNVLITTNREIVEGIVTEVGSGYAALTEEGGASVIVNFRNTLAFQPSIPAEVEAE